MRKLLIGIQCMLLLAIVVSCSKDEETTTMSAKWYPEIIDVTVDGIPAVITNAMRDEMLKYINFDDCVKTTYVDLKSDGSYTSFSPCDSKTTTGTWAENGTNLTLTDNNSATNSVTLTILSLGASELKLDISNIISDINWNEILEQNGISTTIDFSKAKAVLTLVKR